MKNYQLLWNALEWGVLFILPIFYLLVIYYYLLMVLFFLLVAEGLSISLYNAKLSTSLKGIRVGVPLYITHVLFVDDILLFIYGLRKDVEKLKLIINPFFWATSMLINIVKSSISFMNISDMGLNIF